MAKLAHERILITGGAGFIASRLQQPLLEASHSVAIVDNLGTIGSEYINPAATFYPVDIIHPEELVDAFQDFGPTIVFHAAARLPYACESSTQEWETNAVGTVNVLNAARRAGTVKKLIDSSSAAVYGETDEQEPLDEDYPKMPKLPYGRSKLFSEMRILLAGDAYDFEPSILRYANVYGPGQQERAGLIPALTRQFLNGGPVVISGDGSNLRDYVHVDDVVHANLAALRHQGGGIWNISTGTGTSNRTVAEGIKNTLSSPIEPIYDTGRSAGVQRSMLSPIRAQRDLRWEQRVSLQQGLTETVLYYKQKRANA